MEIGERVVEACCACSVDDLALHPSAIKEIEAFVQCISERDAWHIVIHILILCIEICKVHSSFQDYIAFFLFSLITYSK